MSDTSRTDDAQFGTGRVSVDFARQLERENAAMREAIKEAYDLVCWLAPNSDGLHHRSATAALSILQPYLK